MRQKGSAPPWNQKRKAQTPKAAGPHTQRDFVCVLPKALLKLSKLCMFQLLLGFFLIIEILTDYVF